MRSPVAVVLGAVLAVGCGGGDGGPTVAPKSPPELVGTTPAEGAAEVRTADTIELRFSKPVRPGFTVRLYSGDTLVPLVENAIASHDDDTRYTIQPPVGLALPANMRLEVSGVTDRIDQPLAGQPVNVHWTYPAWLPMPTSFGAGSCFAGLSPLVIRAAGSEGPYVSATDGYGKYCVARWSGAGWTELAPFTGASASNGVTLAADPAGGIVACAHESRWTVHRSDGDAPWQVLPDLPTLSSEAVQACTPAFRDGVLHVVVRYKTAAPYTHRVYKLMNGAWQLQGQDLVTSTVASDDYGYDLAGDGSGLVLRIAGDVHRLADGQAAWADVATPSMISGAPGIAYGRDGLVGVVAKTLSAYSGGTWNSLGISADVSAVFASAAFPTVVLQRPTAGGGSTYPNVRVQEISGGAWRTLGSDQSGAPAVFAAVDATGHIFLVIWTHVYQYNR